MKTTLNIIPTTLSNGSNICHNLQPSHNGESLTVIPSLSPLVEGNYKPFHHLQLHDGRLVVLFLSGLIVYSLVIDQHSFSDTPSQPTLITTLQAEPSCAVNADNSVFLMIPNGAYRIDYDADTNHWTDLGIMPPLPTLEIEATNLTDFSVTVPPISLAGDYTHWRGTLNKADLSTLSSQLLNAYTQLSHDTFAAGFFLQPVLARYHLLDAKGNTLFTSQPTMLSAPSGFQCVDLLTLSTNDFKTINSFNLSAIGYQIGVSSQLLDNSPWAEVVASASIEVSPMLDPINTNVSAQCRLDAIDTSQGNIAVYMPGASVTMIPATDYRRDIIKLAIATFESSASELALFPHPYSTKLPSQPLTPQSHIVNARHAASLPFSAQTAITMGDVILWGDVSPLRPYAPALPTFVASKKIDSGFWRGCVSVTFTSGDERMVWSGSGNNNCPLLINPLLSYPCDDASEITISISCGGSIVSQSFPLTPLPGSNCAIYLHHSLKPFAITTATDMYIVPSQHSIPHLNHGNIAVSQLSDPFNILTTQHIDCGDIVAITPAVRSTSSWDFARTHAYAFTTTGTFAISINAARNTISAHIIDNRHIINKNMTATANNAVYAIASGDLISITGSRSTTLKRNIEASAIAWDNNLHFLWCHNGDSTAHLFDFDLKVETTCDTPSSSQIFSACGTLLISDGNTVKISNNTNNTSIPVKWQRSVFIDSPRHRIINATFFTSATNFNGSISIRAHSGAGTENSYPLTTLNIKGAINAPIPIKIIAPHRPYIDISINANVSTDFNLHNILLSCTQS